MRFKLYCHKDVRDLGIVDKQGNWDIDKLKEHIEICPACSRFRYVPGDHLLEHVKNVLSL